MTPSESEARQYTDVLGDVEYMGLAQAYRLEDVPRSGSEVFSLMRDSSLDADDYLSAFFDTVLSASEPTSSRCRHRADSARAARRAVAGCSTMN